MKITPVLQEIGLTKGEAKVYLSLLDIGPSTTGAIIKQANVSRSKVYEMLEGLIKKGLVSYIIKKDIKHYQAHDPKSIAEYLRKKQQILQEQEKEIEKVIPQLRKRISELHKPQTATIYEGEKGIASMFSVVRNTLIKGEEYFAIGIDPAKYDETKLVNVLLKHHQKRAEKRIRVKLLVTENVKNTKLHTMILATKLIEARKLRTPLPNSTIIFSGHVATFTWEPQPVCVLTKSDIIYDRYKTFFLEQWKNAST